MAKAKSNEEKSKKVENKISVGIIQLDLTKDTIWKSTTTSFPKTTDRGFDIETSNLQIVFRMTEKEYYELIDLLMEDAHTDFEKSEQDSSMLEDFQDFIRNKISGDF